MSRLSNLVTIWVIAWLCLLVIVVGSVKPGKISINCLQFIPRHFWNRSVYDQGAEQLHLDYKLSQLPHLAKCLNQTAAGTEYTVQLVAVAETDGGRESCCDMQCQSATIYHQVGLANILDSERQSNQTVSLSYVVGKFFIRLVRVVEEGGGTCEEGSFSSCSSVCSPVLQFGDIDTQPCRDSQETSSASNVSSSDHDVVINQSFHDRDQTCQFEVEIFFPVCHSIQSYSSANVSLVEVSLNQSCSDLDLMWDWQNSEVISLSFYIFFNAFNLSFQARNTSVEKINFCGSDRCNVTSDSSLFGTISYSLQTNINTSFCLLVEIQHPLCSRETSLRTDSFCVLPVSSPVVCSPDLWPGQFWLSEPMFIALVCAILITCLLCLFWIVVKCAREQVASLTSSPEPDKDALKNKNIPRSLTIDEMEHIIRLRQQELILVYFPDTEMFKTLNRKFRDFLMSLNILNVNDVIDIYDEKFSDCPDGFLKNPDGWVSNLLSDPERRIVLVTSKLAYECLIHMRKGLDPPKFPENDNYSKLLVHILKYLDSDMFRGNYRRLICVRYEDLKICDRRYGSESFNIVPGTEYLLPQHLEDIARWIHPIEARPGLWADHRPQVRALMEYIKDYRHREVRLSRYNLERNPYNFSLILFFNDSLERIVFEVNRCH